MQVPCASEEECEVIEVLDIVTAAPHNVVRDKSNEMGNCLIAAFMTTAGAEAERGSVRGKEHSAGTMTGMSN